jgi:hypothetical protein
LDLPLSFKNQIMESMQVFQRLQQEKAAAAENERLQKRATTAVQSEALRDNLREQIKP